MSNRVYEDASTPAAGMSFRDFDSGELMKFVSDEFHGQVVIKTYDGGYTWLDDGYYYDAEIAAQHDDTNRFISISKVTIESE